MIDQANDKNICLDIWIETYIFKSKNDEDFTKFNAGSLNTYLLDIKEIDKLKFEDFNIHSFDKIMYPYSYKKLWQEHKSNTLQVMRNFLHDCNYLRKQRFLLEKGNHCVFTDKRLRVHDFDTRFKKGGENDSFIYLFHLLLINGYYSSNIISTKLRLTSKSIIQIILGVDLYLVDDNNEHVNFDQYFNSFLSPLFQDIKKSNYRKYVNYYNKNYKYNKKTILDIDQKELYLQFKNHFYQNTKMFKKVIKNIGKINAKIFYNKLIEYFQFLVTDHIIIIDIYLIIRLFSEFDFSTSDKKRSPCKLNIDTGAKSPKYNIIYAGPIVQILNIF